MRDFRGFVRRERNDRPVDAKCDDEAGLGVAFAHMLYREEVDVYSSAKRSIVSAKCGSFDKASQASPNVLDRYVAVGRTSTVKWLAGRGRIWGSCLVTKCAEC